MHYENKRFHFSVHCGSESEKYATVFVTCEEKKFVNLIKSLVKTCSDLCFRFIHLLCYPVLRNYLIFGEIDFVK